MLKEERQNLILEQLRHEGKVLASQLSLAFNVSEDTIRRDLHELAEAQLIQRVHGGALLSSPTSPSYAARQKQATLAKTAIAQAAVKLIQNGQVLIFDGGTTVLQVAQQLPLDLEITVITNSPPVASTLTEHPYVEVILVGGKIYKSSQVAIGVETVETLRTFRADLCMLGICSLHPEEGITVPLLEEVYVKRAMIASAAEVVALASANKLNTASPYVVGPLKDLTHLITEANLPTETLEPYYKSGLTIITA
jgi:DeoR/GlpR family transcriptional regulator of sugar metabolism